MDVELLGKRMKSRRNELGITLQDIADQIHVNRSTIQRYESGKIKDIKIPIINSIASYLAVNPKWLLGLTDIKTHSEEYERATHLMNLYFNSVVKWSEDELFNEQETTMIREHFFDLLLRYKEIVESFLQLQLKWNSSKNIMNELYENKNDEEIKAIFLKSGLENELKMASSWIDQFPEWIARNEFNKD